MNCERCTTELSIDGDDRIKIFGSKVRLCPLHKTAGALLEACKVRVDEWHSTFGNMERREPKSLKLARVAIAEAEK